MANDFATSVVQVGRADLAIPLFERSVATVLRKRQAVEARCVLSNLGIALAASNQLARAHQAFDHAFEVAGAVAGEELTKAHLHLASFHAECGSLLAAEKHRAAFLELPTPTHRAIYRPGDAEEAFACLDFYRGTLADASLDEAERLATEGNNRFAVRRLHALRGELALKQNEPEAAIAAFERAVEMGREVGLDVRDAEARLALANLRAGRAEQAAELIARHRNPSGEHAVAMAELCLEKDESELAREHVLVGYEWAWADGPPYVNAWELERCRAVLAALGEPEPELPPFDLSKVEPFPHEAEINAFIAWLEAGKSGRDS